jgi:hypothetical protein
VKFWGVLYAKVKGVAVVKASENWRIENYLQFIKTQEAVQHIGRR